MPTGKKSSLKGRAANPKTILAIIGLILFGLGILKEIEAANENAPVTPGFFVILFCGLAAVPWILAIVIGSAESKKGK